MVGQLKQILDPSTEGNINGVGAALVKAARGETVETADTASKSEVGPEIRRSCQESEVWSLQSFHHFFVCVKRWKCLCDSHSIRRNNILK